MDKINGKRILLLYARFFEYDKIVRDRLIRRGAIVDLFDARANISTIEKALLKKTEKFYKKKQIKFHKKICNLCKENNYDFIFTNENLDYSIINTYKEFFPNSIFILYLDDSVKNLRNVDKTFKFYDKVLTFDRMDAGHYNIKFRPLFFNNLIERNESSFTKYDLCFIGTAHSDRLNVINKICDKYPDLYYNFFLYLQSKLLYFYYFLLKKEYRKYRFNFFKYKKIKMVEVVQMMKESNAILDIQHPLQTGLTIRTIEALGMGKKIITTNEDIINYDFYNQDNICIIDRENPQIDLNFFKKNYNPIDDDIYNKYSIDGWIDEVFCMEMK